MSKDQLHRVFIGIDPDVDKSGYAKWIKKENALTIHKLSFFEIYERLNEERILNGDVLLVRIEAGWLNKKSNFHGHVYQRKSVGEKIAKNVGSNHQVGKLIGEMCEYLGINYEFVIPMGKITPEYFTKITGIAAKKKDQDMIDAAMLVYDL